MVDFDRAAHLRPRADEIESLLSSPEARILPLWRNRNLVRTGNNTDLVRLAPDEALLAKATCTVFLGLEEGRPCFAVALPAAEEHEMPEGDFNDLRMAGGFMVRHEADLAAYARGLTYWHRHNRYCAKCGSETTISDAGHVRACPTCDKKHFPRTDPAIMALIIDGDRCLLARQPKWPSKMFSILAGFVEPGESLEAAVIREVREEVGVEVSNPQYVRSQGWPFPSSLMLGFAMHATTKDIELGDDELEEARWVSREQIVAAEEIFVPPKYSLAGQLIGMFVSADL